MNISDMIEFVNKISSFELKEAGCEDGVSMSEIREDKVEESLCQMKRQVSVDKVEGV